MLMKGMKKDMALCMCCQLIATITDVLKLTMSIDALGTIQNCGVVYSIAEKLVNQLTSYVLLIFHSEKTMHEMSCLHYNKDSLNEIV